MRPQCEHSAFVLQAASLATSESRERIVLITFQISDDSKRDTEILFRSPRAANAPEANTSDSGSPSKTYNAFVKNTVF